MPGTGTTALSIAIVDDGKRGHTRQSESLADALARRVQVAIARHDAPRLVAVPAYARRLARDAPDLLIGAGHGTHAALVAGRLASRTRTIVLMNPSLPRRLFDLTIVPAHDAVPEDARTVVSRGPLCPAPPAGIVREPGTTLVLLGGPSPHYRFDEQRVAAAIARVEADATGPLTIADSRRTPASTVARVAAHISAAEFVRFGDVGPDWLPATLARTETVWVTPDSVSMLYEALTAGCRVGVFALDATPPSRVVDAVAALIAEGRIATLGPDGPRHVAGATEPFDEAGRVADTIVERYLPRWGLVAGTHTR